MTPSAKGSGRPASAPALRVLMSAEMLAEVCRISDLKGLSVSEYIRHLIREEFEREQRREAQENAE